jgi:hypothetical protein
MSPNELSQLAPLAEQLNAKSNEINETLKLVNDKLSALNVGVEVWLGPWKEDAPGYFQIGFAKVSDSWQLATRTCDAEEDQSRLGYEEWIAVPGTCGFAKPILQASRDVRIDTLSVLPRLLAEIKAEISATLQTIEAGKKIAAEL